jgi:flagellar hook-basal body complex protein FliE
MSEMIPGIGGVGGGAGVSPLAPGRPLRTLAPLDGPSFGDTLRQALGQVSAVQDNAAEKVGAFLRGENVELHQVMAAGSEATIALEMLVEVRNKLLEAYQSLATMQS